MPYIKTPQDIDWFYERTGTGPLLVFLHGWASDRRVWRQQQDYFADGHTVISVDWPGHGGSSWKDISLKDLAEGLRLVLERLEGRPFDCVASSMGGLVAVRFNTLFPGKMRRLSLVGSSGRFSQSADYPYGLPAPRIRKLRAQVREEYPAILKVFFRSLFTVEERNSARYRWLSMFRTKDDWPGQKPLMHYLRLLEQWDLREEFNGLQIPVQLIFGQKDPLCPSELARQLKDDLKTARLDFIEGCGHFPFITRPEIYNRLVADFLRSGT